MAALTLASLWVLACGGNGPAPAEPITADAKPVQVPEGYRVATNWESGAQSVYKRDPKGAETGTWTP